MTTTDKLTDEALVHRAVLDWIKEDAPIGIKMQMTPDLANKLSDRIAHRRASQAAPALKICQFCHDYGASSCTCFDEAEMGAAKAATAPSDHLVSVGKASGMVEARVSLAARQIRQTLRDYGHRCAETSLPDLIAADVDAALRKQDELHAPAPSDGLREENERLRYVLDGVRGAIDTGRNEPLMVWRDQINIALDHAALSASPTQEGGE